MSIVINADLKIEDPEDFSVVLRPSNNIEQPFPVRVNPDQGTTIVTIEDEDGKIKNGILYLTHILHKCFEKIFIILHNMSYEKFVNYM